MFILQNTDGRVPFLPVLHLVLPEVALVVLVALKLPLPLKFAASGFLLSGIIYVLTCTTTGNVRDDYAVGSAVLGNTFFNVILFVWLTDPMKDFRYIRGEDRSPLLSRPLFSRLYNSACIVRNNRLIGWNVQVCLSYRDPSTVLTFPPLSGRQCSTPMHDTLPVLPTPYPSASLEHLPHRPHRSFHLPQPCPVRHRIRCAGP